MRSDLANRAASLDGRTFRVRGMASPLVPGDLVQLERLFGFAPAPVFVQMRKRRTREGGGDVRVPRRQ